MLEPGADLTLTIDRPAAGGRMIARHEGRVILVGGTIPGEVVRARVERVGRGVVYAATVEVLEPSTDRRPTMADPACGGNVYAHIAYERQLTLKGAVIADAFARIARRPLPSAVPVAASPERGYRMRARLHVRSGGVGFFREGTHDLCDPASTGQLLPETADVLARLSDRMRGERIDAVSSIELAANIPASERALHREVPRAVSREAPVRLVEGLDVTGVSASGPNGWDDVTLTGTPSVADALAAPHDGDALGTVTLRRHARAFFQANRFLLPGLVSRVRALVPAGPVLALYAGVGLFAVTLAAAGVGKVSAVEGDRVSAADLQHNARPYEKCLRTFLMPVERFLDGQRGEGAGTLILDPPRTGMSRAAAAGVVSLRPPRIVFVSCDVATLARDTGRLMEAGYALESVEAFDLFPNTAHVEAVAVLAISPGGTRR